MIANKKRKFFLPRKTFGTGGSATGFFLNSNTAYDGQNEKEKEIDQKKGKKDLHRGESDTR
jgi:hypothetical protein